MTQGPSLLFIHGFCSEIYIPSLHIQRKAGDEFRTYRKTRKNTHLYTWPISKVFSFWQAIDPWSYLQLYRDELYKSQQIATWEALHEQIQRCTPEVIFAHSMGCALLLGYLEMYGLPTSVKRIIFVQADVATTLPTAVEQELQKRNLVIENIHCCWDQALLTSAIYHRRGRGGLTGIRSPMVQNVVYPLTKLWNLHTAGLRTERFYTDVCGL